MKTLLTPNQKSSLNSLVLLRIACIIAILTVCISFVSEAQTLIPYSGSNALSCGSNTTLCTHAGCGGTYSNSANGYTVLNAAGNAVISISGSYNTESCCDFIRIYSGSGTGGTLLATYNGSGSISYTGAAGQTLTVSFTSDGSVTGTGLNASVTYSGSCSGDHCYTCPSYDFSINPSATAQTHSSSTSEASGCRIYAVPVIAGADYTFTMCSSGGTYSGDTRIILYNSSCVELVNNDDYCGVGSQVTWTATYSGTAYLRIAHYSNSGTVSWTLAYWRSVLPGENCSNAQNLASLSNPYSGSTFGYADDVSTCRTGYPDRVFYIDVPNNYLLDIWEASNDYDEYEYVGYGSSCPGTQIQCWDNDGLAHTTWTNTTGSTQRVWYIQDACCGTGYGNFTLQYSLTSACSTPSSPGSLSGSGTGQTTATISWSASSGSATITYYYSVYTSGGSYVTGGNTTSTSAAITGLSCSTAYYFTVYATTSCNGTSSSTITSSNFSTPACTAPGCSSTNLGTIYPGNCSASFSSYSAGTIPYWSFSANAGTIYHFAMFGNAEDSHLRIYNSSFGMVAENDDNGPFIGGTPSSISWSCPSSGTYYISAAHHSCSNLSNAGSLGYWCTPVAYTSGSGATLSVTSSVQNQSYAAGGMYWFYFSASAGSKYEFNLCANTEDTYIRILDNTWTQLAYSDDNGIDCSGSAASLVFTAPSTTTYIVAINHFSCSAFSNSSNMAYSLCQTPGDQATYGSNSWIGYVYDGTDLNTYMGYYTEAENFTTNWGSGQPSGSNLYKCASMDNDNFSVRYKMNKTYARSFYKFTSNSDDGVRLSTDGGSSFGVYNVWDCNANTRAGVVLLDGNYNMVMDYRECGGGAQAECQMCQMSGDYTIPSAGTWNAYVFDDQSVELNKYQGTFTKSALTFNDDWGSGQPGMVGQRCSQSMDNDNFSVRYVGYNYYPAGNYVFRCISDDGQALSVNLTNVVNNNIFNNWDASTHDNISGDVALNGYYYQYFDMRENTGGARASFNVCRRPANPTSASADLTWVCPGTAVTLTASGVDGNQPVVWYSGSCGGTSVGSGTSIVVNPLVSTTYYCRNRNTSDAGGLNVLDLLSSGCASVTVTVGPPANDNCASPIDIGSSLPYTSAVLSNSCATDDSPASACNGPYKNLWWKVTSPACGTMTANTCTGNTNFDSKIAVFTGSCGSFTEVVCNDDYCGLQSSVSWPSVSGVTYYISVGTYSTGTIPGNLQLNVTTTADATAPTADGITINNSCWIADDRHVYTITGKASDYQGIGGNTYGMLALINYQGTRSGSYGGYFAWNTSLAALNAQGYTLDQGEAQGGGYFGKSNSFGPTTVTLVNAVTSVVGTQRTVTFYVRPNSAFPVFPDNDISLYAMDGCGNITNWVNYDLNFSSQLSQQITCPSNISVCGSQVVNYSTPTSTCNTSVVQNAGLASGSVFPIGTTTITYNTYYPNGAGGYFNYAPGASNQTIALAACESVYGAGGCDIGSCGNFTYYKKTGDLSCNCAKPVGSYEFIYSNAGYTQAGQDYGGKSTDVTGNQLFARVKTSAGCDANSWSITVPALGQGGASCSFTVNVAQPGTAQSCPVNAGTISCTPFTSSINSSDPGYTNNYTGTTNHSGNDVWYSFTLASASWVDMGSCGSGWDTYAHLWDGSSELAYNDDHGTVCPGEMAGSIRQYLSAGTYYFISEGYSSNGLLNTTIVNSTPSGTTGVSASTVCTGTGVTFTATPSYGTVVCLQYQWDGTGGAWTDNWTTSNPYTWTSGNPGHTLYVRAKCSNNGCIGYTSPASVDVLYYPSGGTITGITPIAYGATAVPYSISGVSNVTSYTWSVPAGASIASGQGTSAITVNWGTSTGGNVSCTPGNGICAGSAINFAVTRLGCFAGNNSLSSVAAPTSCGVTLVDYWHYTGDYCAVTGVAATTQYKVQSSIYTNYFTITKDAPNGQVIAAGVSPLSWTSTTAGTYYIHVSDDANCGTGTSPHAAITIEKNLNSGYSAQGFGNNFWNVNVYGHLSGCCDIDLNTFAGYYTENNLSFNTTTRWGDGNAPSDANNASGAGYLGCPVSSEWHGYIYKRKGFPAANYRIDITKDDGYILIINGVTVSSNFSSGVVSNDAWCGQLNASSEVEIRCFDWLLNSKAIVTFTALSAAISPSDMTICTGTSPGTFTSTPSGFMNTPTYQWYINGAAAGTSNTYNPGSLSNPPNATYGIYCVVSGDGCSVNTPTTTVSVNPLPVAAGTISGTAVVCQAQSGVAFSLPAITNASGYVWNYSGSGFSISSGGNTNSIIADFSANATAGDLTVYGTNGCGNGTASAAYAITVNTLSTAPTGITGTTTVCNGSATTLTVGGGTDGTGASYEWFSGLCGGISAGSGSSITVAPNVNTTYYVRRTGSCNTTSCASELITVISPSATTPTVIANGDYVWSGVTSNDWNNATNWLKYSGSSFGVPVAPPDPATNVYLRALGGCTGYGLSLSSANGNCNTMVIESGNTFAMSGGRTLHVYGDWINDGTFNENNGTVSFEGPVAQQIANAETFNNLVIDNPAGLSLHAAVTVSASLSLMNGALDNSSYLTISDNATIYRNQGTLLHVPTFGTTVNMHYSGATTTGLELPASANVIRNLCVDAGIHSIVELSAPARVNNQLILISGVVRTTAANILTMADNATVSGSNSNSFVDGPMRKIGDDAFEFPVGRVAGTTYVWAPIRIADPGSDPGDSFVAEYFLQSPPNNWSLGDMCSGSGLDHVSGHEYWDLTREAGTTYPDVTIYYKDAQQSGINDLVGLAIAHYQMCNGSLKWSSMNGTAIGGLGPGGQGQITGTGFTSYSPISFGAKTGSSNPLPVSILNFDAQCGSEGPAVTWTTVSENNSAFFAVEKSPDMISWAECGLVGAAGYSSSPISYEFNERSTSDELVYYRLRQVDYDGKQEYFGPIALKCSPDVPFEISVYPNPFTDQVNILFSGAAPAAVDIVVRDIIGNIICRKTSAEANISVFTLNPGSGIASGIYTIEVITEFGKQHFKMVKN